MFPMEKQHDYSGFEEEPDTDQVRILNSLVEQLVVADAQETELEERLKVAKKLAQDLRENTIPAQMEQMGLKEIVTAAGVRVQLKTDVQASFFAKAPSKREPAFQWLRDHDHDGLIKNVVSAQFDREEQGVAEKFAAYCKAFSEPVDVQQKRDIHNQTLCAFLREQLREGHPPPLELFGAREYKKVLIDTKASKK